MSANHSVRLELVLGLLEIVLRLQIGLGQAFLIGGLNLFADLDDQIEILALAQVWYEYEWELVFPDDF